MNLIELVSIIVPVYNVDQYLRRCLDSIRSQSYKNIEIILVDDGSTDLSGIICDEYKNIDNRVLVIHKDNGGLSDARNTGIQYATGEWVVFIDSDDIVTKDFIEVLVNGVTHYQADICTCYFKLIDDNVDSLTNDSNSSKVKYESLDAVTMMLSEHNVSTSAWGKLAKKEIWLRHPFPKGRKFEDLPVTWKVFLDSKYVIVDNARLYGYRKRPTSISQVSSTSFRSLDDYYKSIYQIDSELSAMINSFNIKSALSFRISLECTRLIGMVNSSNIVSSNDKILIDEIMCNALNMLRKNLIGAMFALHAPVVQRIRILVVGFFPKCASIFMR